MLSMRPGTAAERIQGIICFAKSRLACRKRIERDHHVPNLLLWQCCAGQDGSNQETTAAEEDIMTVVSVAWNDLSSLTVVHVSQLLVFFLHLSWVRCDSAPSHEIS